MSPNPAVLPENVWPETAVRDVDGMLTIGGLRIDELVAKFGSPLFVMDEVHVRSRARDYIAAYKNTSVPTDVFYAGKAFLSTTSTRWLAEEGLGIDVASAGELEVALRAGVNPDRIVLHGNNKSVSELERAVEVGVGRIVIDSLIEIERLNEIAARAGVVIQVLLRLTVGVEAHTHEFIATAHEDQKFGLSVNSGMALAAAEAVLAASSLSLAGLHSHIGSQIFDSAGFEVAAHRVIEFAALLRDTFDFTISELDLGGGMGIAYLPEEDPMPIEHMAKAIQDIVATECARVHLPIPHLSVEPGRAIVGNAAVTIYEVGTVKPVSLDGGLTRSYISVDGGMSDNIRTALYDAQYSVVLASREGSSHLGTARVVGKHCESGDIVVRDAQLPTDIRPGDLLAVAATGAYCRAMASNYNYLPRPAVVGVRDGKATVLLRRETIDDLLGLDPGAN